MANLQDCKITQICKFSRGQLSFTDPVIPFLCGKGKRDKEHERAVAVVSWGRWNAYKWSKTCVQINL